MLTQRACEPDTHKLEGQRVSLCEVVMLWHTLSRTSFLKFLSAATLMHTQLVGHTWQSTDHGIWDCKTFCKWEHTQVWNMMREVLLCRIHIWGTRLLFIFLQKQMSQVKRRYMGSYLDGVDIHRKCSHTVICKMCSKRTSYNFWPVQ
jgi:hypothetical protein